MAKFDTDFTEDDIIDYARMRYSTKNHLGSDFMHLMEDGSFEPILDPNTGKMTYRTTTFGWYMNYVSPAAPRLILEGVKSGLHFIGGQHWEQKHDYFTRVFGSLALGDPGAMGEFGYQVGRLGYEYDHPLRNAARIFGFGADVLVNWEGKVGFLPRAGLRRGAVFLRTNQALKNGGDFTAFGRSMSMGGVFGGLTYAITGDLSNAVIAGALPAALQLKTDIADFKKNSQIFSPLIAEKKSRGQRLKIAFKTAMYDMHLDFKPYSIAGMTMNTSKVIPSFLRKVGFNEQLDKISNNRYAGLLRGEFSRRFKD